MLQYVKTSITFFWKPSAIASFTNVPHRLADAKGNAVLIIERTPVAFNQGLKVGAFITYDIE